MCTRNIHTEKEQDTERDVTEIRQFKSCLLGMSGYQILRLFFLTVAMIKSHQFQLNLVV